MYFDLSGLDARRSYKLMTATVVPRPIAWVVSADAQERVNAAPFSFFNCFGGQPGGYTRTRDAFSMRQLDFDEWQATRGTAANHGASQP